MVGRYALNITRMKTLSVFWNCLTLCSLITATLSLPVQAQHSLTPLSQSRLTIQAVSSPLVERPADLRHSAYFDLTGIQKTDEGNPDLPRPQSVLFKSMMIPGWGQVVNKQAWKVPIVYGLIGGLTWYSIFLTKKYHDYRAAFYNANHDDINPDFGETPSYIPEGVSPNELKFTRNRFRNRRDFIYITVVLAYGLNVIDAYVFAHLRSFDVSDDLSMNTKIAPDIISGGTPGVSVTIDLIPRTGKE